MWQQPQAGKDETTHKEAQEPDARRVALALASERACDRQAGLANQQAKAKAQALTPSESIDDPSTAHQPEGQRPEMTAG